VGGECVRVGGVNLHLGGGVEEGVGNDAEGVGGGGAPEDDIG
jgi:hypothetical protein